MKNYFVISALVMALFGACKNRTSKISEIPSEWSELHGQIDKAESIVSRLSKESYGENSKSDKTVLKAVLKDIPVIAKRLYDSAKLPVPQDFFRITSDDRLAMLDLPDQIPFVVLDNITITLEEIREVVKSIQPHFGKIVLITGNGLAKNIGPKHRWSDQGTVFGKLMKLASFVVFGTQSNSLEPAQSPKLFGHQACLIAGLDITIQGFETLAGPCLDAGGFLF